MEFAGHKLISVIVATIIFLLTSIIIFIFILLLIYIAISFFFPVSEGLQAIRFEDGTTAFIAHPNAETLFDESGALDSATLDTLTQVCEVPVE